MITNKELKNIISEMVISSERITNEKKLGLLEFVKSLNETDLNRILKGSKLLEFKKMTKEEAKKEAVKAYKRSLEKDLEKIKNKIKDVNKKIEEVK
jgi:hypothetical protein